MSELGFIPTEEDNSVVEYGGFRFTVEEVDERRIERILAERMLEEEIKEEANSSNKKKKDTK